MDNTLIHIITTFGGDAWIEDILCAVLTFVVCTNFDLSLKWNASSGFNTTESWWMNILAKERITGCLWQQDPGAKAQTP